MTKLSFIAMAFALTAPGAFADCLTDADLSRGVVARFDNGDFTVMRRMGDGYLQIDETYADGSPTMRFRAHRGLYYVQEFELGPNGAAVPGTGLTIAFETDPAVLPDPLPGLSWQGPTVNRFDDGSSRNEITSFEYSRHEPITLSGCSYETIATSIRYDWGADGGLNLQYLYLPAVGTAIILSNQFDGEDQFSTVPVALDRFTK